MSKGSERVLNIISLGAGVQSSCLYLMAAAGEFEAVPDAAIFADTQSEPDAVYRQLDYLREKAGHVIPIHVVTQGNLGGEDLAAISGRRKRVAQPPFYVLNSDGDGLDEGGMLWRQCTKDYKLIPVRREVRRLLKECGLKHAAMWIGISTDEWTRMKPARQKYLTNRYPLIEKEISRDGCLRWLRTNEHPRPPKSACNFCPYTSDRRWREMKKDAPGEFVKAVAFDHALREGKMPGVTGDCYVHRSFVPLDEVDLSTAEDRGQLTLFGEFTSECEGLCGV